MDDQLVMRWYGKDQRGLEVKFGNRQASFVDLQIQGPIGEPSIYVVTRGLKVVDYSFDMNDARNKARTFALEIANRTAIVKRHGGRIIDETAMSNPD